MRMIRITLPLVCCLALTAGAVPARALASTSPKETLRKTNDQLRKLLKEPDPTKVRSSIKELVNGFLDYQELSTRALGEHWEKLKPEQRTEFVGVLRDLIERNYVRQLRSNVDYDVVYKTEDVKGKEATVQTAVKAKRKGREVEIPIDYKLSERGGKWVVFDVITEEVSLVRNYRSQFQKIIEKDGYEGLIAKMKKRLAETPEN
jgi:phospholipid transport system substrate-binding protein